jgi:DNA repair photolyase
VRWSEVVDEPGRLFDLPDREVGTAEFRGLTFHHVRTKRLINTLPPSSRMASMFRHTINAYRGCSHSCSYCFARPTHDYLGFDMDEDFDREIVVKVNAVERLQAELHPKRWPGEAIAMGTNTDPYQRAEGKYRLTRGIVEVLSAARNPFSILTKSTLVVGDAELLGEASRRTDVSVSFSIGTLDEDVWRATEPGTPHPRQRVAAIAKLRAAGVRAGVLVAPILPGLSDGAEQIEAVVAACSEAGATSISGGMLLRLGPGVREVYLRRLRVTHPELAERTEATYRGSNAPKALRERVAHDFARALDRHPSAVTAPRRSWRPTTPPAPPSPKPPAEQLGLAL